MSDRSCLTHVIPRPSLGSRLFGGRNYKVGSIVLYGRHKLSHCWDTSLPNRTSEYYLHQTPMIELNCPPPTVYSITIIEVFPR